MTQAQIHYDPRVGERPLLIGALVMAIIGPAALMTAFVTGNEVIGWACIGASVIGLALLIVDTLHARQQRDAPSAATTDGVLAFDADFPDERPAIDAPIHSGNDHEVQREIIREEWCGAAPGQRSL